MSTYEYTDRHGSELWIRKHPDKVRVEVSSRLMDVAFEDAPAVALAILEAAEIGNASSRHLAAAWRNLNRHETERKAEAEREAEDAKVREFFLALNPGNFIAADVEVDDRVREQYRAARNYFAKEGQS